MEKYVFTLPTNHINVIMTALGEMPMKVVNSTYEILRSQMQSQDAEKNNDKTCKEGDSN